MQQLRGTTCQDISHRKRWRVFDEIGGHFQPGPSDPGTYNALTDPDILEI